MDHYIDTHAHIYHEDFLPDRIDMLQRCLEQRVTKIFMPNVDHATIDAMLELESRSSGQCVPMMGLHPCSVNATYKEELTIVKQWLDKRPFVAIGEIGLDYHYDFSPRDVQRDVFVEQLATARALSLPVIIHTREADDDTFAVLSAEGRGVGGVFHCFTGGVDRARKALDLGFHLSLAGIVTFRKATDLHEVAGFVPDDRLLVETDSPFLAPVPHRGKRNEPAFVSHVVDAVAERRGTLPSQLAALTTRNFLELFARTAVTPR